MMELTCGLVLVFVSLVAATPHGYGVKGGALAKADATAIAGGYGGVPLAIPSGAGYSGSYSKSSASSFAASSASSSSSSFSFSGNGPTGYGANGVPVASGCATGNCAETGASNIPDIHGAGSIGGSQAGSGAKAAAVTGAVAGVGYSAYSDNKNQVPCSSGNCANKETSPCIGSSCNDGPNSEKCTGGQCGPVGPTNQFPNDQNKCSSGQCGSSAPAYGSNDIHVNIAGSSAPNSNTDGSSYDKPPGYANAGGSTGTGSGYNKPSTYLTVPKDETPCTSPSCSGTGGAYDKDLPSSYNVPIHGSNPGEKVTCASGNCGNTQKGIPEFVPLAPTAPANCASGNCAGNSPVYDNSRPSSTIPNSVGSTSTFAPSGCSTPNCAGAPIRPSVSSPTSKYPNYAQAGAQTNAGATAGVNTASTFAVPKPTTASNEKYPYTGGFGGPAGILKPSDFSIPKPVPTGHSPSPSSPLCTSGNCGPKPQYPQTGPAPNVPYQPAAPSGTYSPSLCTSGSCSLQTTAPSPQYNPGSAPTSGPGGILKPNDYINPASVGTTNYKPIVSGPAGSCTSGNCGAPQSPATAHAPSTSSGSQYNPTSNTGSVAPSSCSTGNCGQPSGYNPTGPSKPIGGFGAPAGFLKPNDYNPGVKPLSPEYSPKPTVTGPGGSCTSGNCGATQSTAASHSESTSGGSQYNPTSNTGSVAPSSCSTGNCGQPSSGYNPTGPSKPIGGFGAPAGFLKPNDFNAGPKPLSPEYSPKPTVTGPGGSCSSGNCGAAQSTATSHSENTSGGSQYNPTSNTGSYAPSSCSSGNCGQPSSGYNPTGPSKPIGGFGAPAGFLKPNDYNTGPKPLSPEYSPKPTVPGTGGSCTAGNCGAAQSTATSHSESTSGGSQYNPTSNTGPYAPTACSTGNCGGQPSSGYNPTGPSKPFGGFGAPAGFLKPNDLNTGTKPLSPEYSPKPTTGSSPPIYSSTPNLPQQKPTYETGANTPQQNPSYGQNSLPRPTGPTGAYNPCPSGNCASSPGNAQNNSPSIQQPTSPTICTSGNCAGQQSSYPSSPQYGYNGASSSSQSQHSAASTGNVGAYNPAACSSGNCVSKPSYSTISNGAQIIPSNPTPCSSGNCGSGSSLPHYGQAGFVNGAHIAVGAAAGAKAVVYTGGFGGPPGLLQPYDDGKIDSNSIIGKQLAGYSGVNHIGIAGNGPASSYDKKLSGAGFASQAGAGAQAAAVAGASAGGYSGINHPGVYNNNGNQVGGCKGGCATNVNGAFNYGAAGGPLNGFNVAGASAKSAATAGAGSYGLAGGFASSSASAHASAGAVAKAGYGRR